MNEDMNQQEQAEFDDFTERTKHFTDAQRYALRNLLSIAIGIIDSPDKPAVLLRAVEGDDGLRRVMVHCLTPDHDEASVMLQYYMEARASVLSAAMNGGEARH
jgi:hypothetical protein